MNKCIIQVIGRKDSGKTLTIEKAVRKLKQVGFKVAVIKHSHHEIDLQGKDTFRFWSSGSDYVAFMNEKDVIMGRFSVDELINLLPTDVIFIEGFKEFKLGEVFEITKPEEAEFLSEKIVDYVEKNCEKIDFTIVGDGKVLDANNKYVIMLYNLMLTLNLSEVKIDRRS